MNNELPKTRQEALALGSNKYFTGKPCKWGHVTPRRINGHCVGCQRERNKREGRPKWHDTEEWKEYQRNYQAKYRNDPKNREALRRNQLKYYVKKHYNGDMEAYERAKAKREAKRARKNQ